MRVCAFVLVIATAAAVHCHAQDAAEPPYSAQQAPALLQSGDPREAAWGAWLAGRFFLTDSAPLLEHAVEIRLNNSRGLEPALDIALDALIQLRVRISSRLLLPIYERRPAQALILASRLGDDGAEMLRTVLTKAQGDEWFVAANLLRERPGTGFASSVLWDVSFTVTVISPNTGFVGGGGPMICSDGALGLLPGYPPWPTYLLSTRPSSGFVVLAPGTKTVFYERRIARAGHTPDPSYCSSAGPVTADDRLAFFKDLDPMKANQYLEVAETDPVLADARIKQFVEQVQATYQAFLQALVRTGRLTPAEAQTLSPVAVRVRGR